MEKIKVLFVCIHNSGRSQMAEAFLNRLGSGVFEAQSAGLEAGVLNPLVVKAMAEIGYDLSRNRTKRAEDFLRAGEKFGYVITVCDAAGAEKCPFFPGPAKKLHWSFEDPAGFTGSESERLNQTRRVRDLIRDKVAEFIRNR